jgi:hypothetical protein
MRTWPIASFVLSSAALIAFVACNNTPASSDNDDSGAAGSAGTTQVDASDDFDPGMDSTVNKPYPPGPYGSTVGAVLANAKFMGYPNPKAVNYTGDAQLIEFADFYDPTGTKGVKALMVNASAGWCSVCNSEQWTIADEEVIYAPKGVKFFEAFFEGGTETDPHPATLTDMQKWASTHTIDWNLALDPGLKLGYLFDTTATPMNMIVDTKTMIIVNLIVGGPEASWFSSNLDPLVGN